MLEQPRAGARLRRGLEFLFDDLGQVKLAIRQARLVLWPLTEAQVVAKFRNLTSRTLSARNIAKIEGLVFELEHTLEMATLSTILRGEKRVANQTFPSA